MRRKDKRESLLWPRRAAWLCALLCMALIGGASLSGCSSAGVASSKQVSPIKKGTQKKTPAKKQSNGGGENGSGKKVSSSELNAACKKLGVSASGVSNANLYVTSASWMGTKYKYGGQSRSGVDCSGLTGLIYKSVYGKNLERSSAGIYDTNVSKIKKTSLKEGDLVFFRTDGKRSSTPNHVGIYLKEDKFIHASTSKGVVVSSMKQDYYVRNYIGSGRVR